MSLDRIHSMIPTIHGVDFSGAADAGKRIWIASGRDAAGRLRIQACMPAEELPGSGSDRGASIAALLDFIRRQRGGLVGLDFPFGLPQTIVGMRSWEEFVLGFPARYRDPERLRAVCRSAAGGRELKRATDSDARTPFSAYNLRLYLQTYHGIRDLLRPLVAGGNARVLPMQRPSSGRPSLMEVCPASTLKDLALYLPYKGRTIAHRRSRRRILKALEGSGLMLARADLRDRILSCS